MNTKSYQSIAHVANSYFSCGLGLSEILSDKNFKKLLSYDKDGLDTLTSIFSAGITRKSMYYHLAGFLDAIMCFRDAKIDGADLPDSNDELFLIIAQIADNWESDFNS